VFLSQPSTSQLGSIKTKRQNWVKKQKVFLSRNAAFLNGGLFSAQSQDSCREAARKGDKSFFRPPFRRCFADLKAKTFHQAHFFRIANKNQFSISIHSKRERGRGREKELSLNCNKYSVRVAFGQRRRNETRLERASPAHHLIRSLFGIKVKVQFNVFEI
jgi:hypothetical protein